MARSYNRLDDLPHSVRMTLHQSPVSLNTPSHYSIVTATPSPSNPHSLQEVMSPRVPNPGLTSAALQQQQLQQAALQASVSSSHGVHQEQRLTSLSTKHDRTMSLLAEFEASMKAKWNDMLQKVQSLESDLDAARTTQAGMREDYEGLMDKSAWEQKQYLAVMLASHAAATDAVTRKQASSSEQIAQFKQSLDKAQAEADLVKTQHEQTLEQTRWVVSKVAELEGLVSRFRERDQTIQRELERSDAKVEAPRQKLQPSPSGLGDIPSGPSYYNLTPEIPGAREDAEEQDETAWWGEGFERPDGGQDQEL